jgi:cation diffusion facilitator CzcD-associated flavoprotein CzcO
MEDVVVVGAGPYGLSTAAHLAGAGVNLRVVGTAMQTWRTQMPSGMRLKSEGYASTLYDPRGDYPLSRFCRERDIPYADIGLPVARETFAEYGQEFARRHVPMLEDRTVVALRSSGSGFELDTADGQTLSTRKVVCAVGITHYAHTAPVLTGLPADLLSHSSAHHDLSIFKGRTVAVVGGGASAADCAALLAGAGATTHLLTRRAALRFHAPPRERSFKDRVRWPMTTIGPGWKSVLCTEAPLAFHALPEPFRVDVTRRYLGPAPCWFVREQVESGVEVHTNVRINNASPHNGRALLEFDESDSAKTLEVDHVLAATGYKVDLGRLAFLDGSMRQRIRAEAGAPALSRWFESSVPGLFFVGPSAANAFGPLLRFACGAEFTARRLARRMR